jgi:tRNA-splicing ligase RtcB
VDLTMIAAESDDRSWDPVQIFDSPEARADPTALAYLSRGVRRVDLAAPAVVLPDFHHKTDMEMPSSIAVATQGSIRPLFTSASVNCGMALIGLDMGAPDRTAIHRFYDAVRRQYPHPPAWRFDLTTAETIRAATEGAEFAVDRYGLEPEALERIEEGGRLDVERYGGATRLRRELPWPSWQISRMRFGTIGPSNHFVELQAVEEILDPLAATRLGLEQGQTTIQYHAGGGQLTGQVGRVFARRKKMSKPLRLQLMVAKPMAHLTSARSLAQARERIALYFRPETTVHRDSVEGRRMLLANAAAMNYGFAFRGATYGGLLAAARRALGARAGRLIVDSPHNSIYEEDVDGENAVVHRHNACRAYPARRMPPGTAFGEVGQAVLVPGTNRTSSYVCVADDRAERSLYSACHGTGMLVARFEREGLSGPDGHGRSTLRFRYSDSAPIEVPHLDDRGVDAGLSILVENGLVRPVARLRPLAVLT